MAITEIFPNPTVKQVIFQIRYPSLFYIENKISELQPRIMKEFRDSKLRYRKMVAFGEVGPDVDVSEIEKGIRENEPSQKIWTFISEKKCELNILSGSLDISSKYHKTYNLGVGDKFRDVIASVLGHFFEVVAIPIIDRVGLRYMDECPIGLDDNGTFKKHYNSALPIDRFGLDRALDMQFVVTTKVGDYSLRYVEALRKRADKFILILDFDGFANNIEPKDCLDVTDKLHEMIAMEFEKTIKEPVKEYMRKGKEEEDAT